MLFLSSGTVDVAPKSAATGQQHPGKTVYHISVVLNEIQGDEAVPDLGKARISHTLVESSQPGQGMNIVAMERSPKLGRAQPELNRWPSASRAGREEREHVVVEENEEELDEVGEEMKTGRFLRQPFKNTDNSWRWDRGSSERSSQGRHARSSSLGCVSVQAKGSVCGDRGAGAGYSSLSRAVLRRTRQDEARLARMTVSMYGDSEKHSLSSQPDPQRLLRRPRSVCVLPGPAPFPLESRTYQPFKRTGALDNDQQYRSRKADLRAVDGLNHVGPQRTLAPAEVSPRARHRKPRPVSMTVLELKKRGSDEEVDSQKSYGNGGGFLKGGFRWRLFGKTLQDKSREREYDRNTESSPKSSKSDAPKSTFSSLRRSISLRIRRTRPREKGSAGLETEPKECSRSRSASEEATMAPRPFSYLTGRTLSTSSRQLEDAGTQYIQYHSKGKVKVMEVPLYPKKLSKPVQEEPPSIWHLIANRFRRKEQPFSGKCESQLSPGKSTPQYPLARSSQSQPVAIETLAATDSHKGQGKSCTAAEIVSLLPLAVDGPSLCAVTGAQACALFSGATK